MRNVLVVAPHPDDEVLGVGGSVLRHLAAGDAVHVVICTRGEASDFGAEQVQRVQSEAREVHRFLGVTGSHFLDLPAAKLDTLATVKINSVLKPVFDSVKPETVYLPHPGDVHRDHQVVFQSAMVCCRPLGDSPPARILTYETVSETDWFAAPITPAFTPNVFVEITEHLQRKLEACAKYASQMQSPPHQRSLEGLRALAATRGNAVGFHYAEAFMLIRERRPH